MDDTRSVVFVAIGTLYALYNTPTESYEVHAYAYIYYIYGTVYHSC